MKIIKAIIERAPDGNFSIYHESGTLPYLITGEGASLEEAMRMFTEGYEDMRAFYKEQGKKFEEVRFEYVYDASSFLRQYAFAFSLAGLEKITGINQKQLSHYVNGVKKPTAKTVMKIQKGIDAFCKNLSTVRLYCK